MSEEPRRPNLRSFLEKLQRRRKRISCTSKCRKSIEATLRKLGGKDAERIKLDDLKEILREPPKGVPAQTLREFVDVSTAYDVGDGSVDLKELLDSSLQTEAGIMQRLSWIFPLLVLLLWMLLGPAVFCPAENWSYLNGLYFSVVSLFTLGTGSGLADGVQVYPQYEGTRIFLVIYVLLGAVLTVWFLLALALSLLWSHEAKLRDLMSPRGDLLAEDGHGKGGSLEDLAGDRPVLRALDLEGGRCDEPKSILEMNKESLRAWAQPRAKLQALAFWGSILLECLLTLTTGVVLVFATSSKVSFLESLSWAVFTSLSLGYASVPGDRINTKVARALEILYIFLSSLCFLHVMHRIASRRLRQEAFRSEEMRRERVLPADLLADLDRNGLGVSRLEFLCASLLASDRVSGHDLSMALELFQRLDPNGSGVLHKPQLATAFQRGKAPLTLEELLESPQLHGTLEAMHFPARKPDERTSAVLEEVYKDYDAVRRSLDAKDEELVAALREQSALEQLRAQAVAQREALRKEVTLLSQMKVDLTQRLDQETDQKRSTQAALDELRTRTRALEQRLRDAQLEQDEARQGFAAASRQLKEAQLQKQEFERRLEEAESEIRDFPRRLQEQAECLQHQADTRIHQAHLEAAQQNLERQGEMQSAQLELKALSSSMEAMRSSMKRPSSPSRCSPRVLPMVAQSGRRGALPWEVWPRSRASDARLLADGKVKDHLEYLDAQVRRQVEHLSTQVQQHADSITAKAQT